MSPPLFPTNPFRHLLCLACQNPKAYSSAAAHLAQAAAAHLPVPVQPPTAARAAASRPAPRPQPAAASHSDITLAAGCAAPPAARCDVPQAGTASGGGDAASGGAASVGGGSALGAARAAACSEPSLALERSWSDSGESLSLNCYEGSRRRASAPAAGDAAGAAAGGAGSTPGGWKAGSPNLRKQSGSGGRKQASGASGAALMVATAAANRAGTGARRALPGLARGQLNALARCGQQGPGVEGGADMLQVQGWQHWQHFQVKAQEGQAEGPPPALQFGSPSGSKGQASVDQQQQEQAVQQAEGSSGGDAGTGSAAAAAAPKGGQGGIKKLLCGSFRFPGGFIGWSSLIDRSEQRDIRLRLNGVQKLCPPTDMVAGGHPYALRAHTRPKHQHVSIAWYYSLYAKRTSFCHHYASASAQMGHT